MIELIRKYPQVLLFGILMTLFSGPGQTFLVSLFIPAMREELGMSQTFIASLYSVATILSAVILPWTGRLVDRLRLLTITMIAGSLLALGCLVLSRAQSVALILLGFLLIRNLGQGTLTLISSTTMARTFGHMRGKALAISNIGYPLSEAIFPFIITTWIASHGWRSGWVLLAGLTVAFFAPAVFLLIRKNPHEDAHAEIHANPEDASNSREPKQSFTTRQMLGDWRYYLLMTYLLMGPGFLTAMFFHQASLIPMWKGWDLKLLSAAFILYAGFRVTVSFMSGILVDKFSAKRIFPYILLPTGVGFLCLVWGESPWWCFAYLGFAGISMGFSFTTTSSMFAELYGTKNFGSIKGTNTALIVLSTAVAPPIMGFLLDKQVQTEGILITMACLILLGSFLAAYALAARDPGLDLKASKS